jgi:hypothetical protein
MIQCDHHRKSGIRCKREAFYFHSAMILNPTPGRDFLARCKAHRILDALPNVVDIDEIKYLIFSVIQS